MRPCVILILCLLACTVHSADDLTSVKVHESPKHAPVVLVQDGEARAVIVVPAEMGLELRAASTDLQHYIKKTTGAKLSVATAPADGQAAFIVRVSEPHPDAAIEGFTIRMTASTVEIIGNDEAGAAHGIYDFLERYVGVRWYWPDYTDDTADTGTSIIPTVTLAIPGTHISDAPVFRMRTRWPSGGPRIGKARMQDHDRRLRTGNTWPVELIVHSPHNWAAIYREKRPEIFQLRGDGGRDWAMLCYGHPRTLMTYLEEIEIQLAAEEPERGRNVIRGKSITVSPADMSVSCCCEYCTKLWQPDGDSYSTASRVLGTFVAALGREVKTRWPDMTVIFLPYKNYTYAPTGIEFPDNVEIQICGMPGLAQYKDSQINASEQRNIDAWIAISGRKIQNWHYSCWPENRTDAAFLYPYTIQAHYQANRDKTIGTFINGVRDHWPRHHLSLYVWLKVLWNPDIDVNAVIDEYCRRMYGPSADSMRHVVRLLIDGWEKTEWEPHVMSPRTVYEQSYPRETVKKIEVLFETAIKQAADDPVVRTRLAYYAPALRAFFAESALISDGEGIKALNVYQVAVDPVIDGKLDDAAWRDIDPVSFVRVTKPINGKTTYDTALRAVWTRRGVTFGFSLSDPDMANLAASIDAESRDASMIWWDDNVEIFVDPSGERRGYYQFIANSNGAVLDAMGQDNPAWNPDGLVVASHRDKDAWSVEIYLPYTIFDKPMLPGTGTIWHGNFTRHRVGDKTAREYQGFNVTTGNPSHNQNAFGPLRFIER